VIWERLQGNGALLMSVGCYQEAGAVPFRNYPGGGNNGVRLMKAITSKEEAVTHIKKKQERN